MVILHIERVADVSSLHVGFLNRIGGDSGKGGTGGVWECGSFEDTELMRIPDVKEC